ncbi:MAG: PstS family phosphate ABC transporter substrate-binding protein [bacterium]|nr:PstS family phosphate ABC transporter substrate-binding protein [bacterium]
MKKLVAFILGVTLMIMLLGCGTGQDNQETGEMKGTITLSGAWALYPMVVKWAEEFQKIYPEIRIEVAAGGAGKGMADCLSEVVDLGMVSREIYPAEVQKGAWWVAVTKDAVVPTMNSENPYINEILEKGIRKDQFTKIWVDSTLKTWGDVLQNNSKEAIGVYTRSDACGAAQVWAQYLGTKQEGLNGVGVYGDPGLAEAVRKDKFGIGFNNINYVYDPSTKLPVEGLVVIPIDLNNNGKVDEDEKFYNNRDQIVNAIAEGKYPSPPARELNLVAHGYPKKKIVVEFLRWILTDGQKYVAESGYINLTQEKLDLELKKLDKEK